MVIAELRQADNAGEHSIVSSLTVRSRPKRLGSFVYRDRAHAELPHVVSFSGGRSSAALTFLAAEEGLLDPDRGDILLFANTSAEHPGTYEFAAECKRRLETEFGLPFFWLEFTTVEDAWRGEYWRKLSYRLVKPIRIEDDPEGFRSSGELFEDLVSLQGMLPNVHSRTCTAKLKLYPSHLLLAEWLGGTDGPAHAGHYWSVADDEYGGLVNPVRAANRYVQARGTASRESVIRRAEHLSTRPSSRPQQYWKDYTEAPVRAASVAAKPAPMRGPEAVPHVRCSALRPMRSARQPSLCRVRCSPKGPRRQDAASRPSLPVNARTFRFTKPALSRKTFAASGRVANSTLTFRPMQATACFAS